MKGGSATKFILDSAFLLSVFQLDENSSTETYSLKNESPVIYLGSDTAGILGLIDASECLPTFGSREEDIRGYLIKGFKELKNADGFLHTVRPIDVENFMKEQLQTLPTNSTVLVLNINGSMSSACLSNYEQHKHKLIVLNVECTADYSIYLKVCPLERMTPVHSNTAADTSLTDMLRKCVLELSVKLVLNCISTIAHVQIGKVYSNVMIDVKVSNHKLYHRAIHIIQNVTGCDYESAVSALLVSVYRNYPNKVAKTGEINLDEINVIAGELPQIVPVAVVMILAKCTINEAIKLLSCQGNVRKAVKSLMQIS